MFLLDYSPYLQITLLERLLFWANLSSYIFAIYATTFVDQLGSDYLVLIAHHVVSLAVIGIAYCVRSHKIGLLVLFTNDFDHVIVGIGKVANHLKVDRNGNVNYALDLFTKFAFVIIVSSW